jgi:mono/diheme cytochrome c family protein
MQRFKLICLLFACGFGWLFVPAGLPISRAKQALNFERDIRPLLYARCVECHGPAKQKSGLRLDQKAAAFKGGASGVAIVPGQSAASELIRRVTSNNPAEMMPPTGARLNPREIALLKAWIDAGAVWPEVENSVKAESKRADKSTWWSLQPLAKAEPPMPKGIPAAWAQSVIDRFVYAKLAERGLQPNAPADRRTLIRRLSYDLIGLPPTPQEVEAFVSDANPQAYEKLVERLLSSPRYGEQWGRHWLDVARFGESVGFERNIVINNLWPYRDYVIQSFNADKPFNRFIVEQLAGDVVGNGDPQVEVGTAFLVCGPYDNVGNQDAAQRALIRANTLDDLITATSNAFLGLTVNCARCHHHKFDPIPQEDYYRLRAAFEGVQHGERVLATQAEQQRYAEQTRPLETRRAELNKEKAALDKVLAERAKAKAAARTSYSLPLVTRHFNEHRFAPVNARYLKFKILAHSTRPRSGVGAQVDEFEVWTPHARNVALASYGTRAAASAGRTADDFANAYGPELAIDGKFGERWFVGNPAELTLTFPRVESIERVVFSNHRTAAPDARGDGLGPFVAEYEILISLDGQTWQKVADSTDRPPLNEALIIARYVREISTLEEQQRLAAIDAKLTRVDAELKRVPALPLVWAGKFEQPTEATFLHKGGDPQRPGAEVRPSSLNVLEAVAPRFELAATAREGERRLGLANWIASDANPLTARVLANRVWQYHFGTGIVDTPSDFGYLGGKPTHPELLDWLAARLQAQGWRLKALHREIVLSQAYRQSSELREAAAKQDKDARLLWRFPPRRLSAEEIRDTLLMIAGKLNLQMGGPGFRLYKYLEDNVATFVPLDQHPPETYRRGEGIVWLIEICQQIN